MKRNSTAIIVLLAVFLVVVALNFIFFIDARQQLETENNADRSSYRNTPYGTSAFYTLLQETGYKVSRYQQPFTQIKQSNINVLFIISLPQSNNPTQEEMSSLDKWIESGGIAVIIDRDIDIPIGGSLVRTEPSRSNEGVHTLQPTELTRGVTTVALSERAPRVKLDSKNATYHIGDDYAAVLADMSSGEGRAIFLSDPHIVANNGIAEADNLALALNFVSDKANTRIAFDEYHHGYAYSGPGGGFLAYFHGTPVPWMFWQLVFGGTLLIYTFARRFARSVPLAHERRTTNMEFVSSMANITRLARASDLAIQNIYSEFRKRLCRAAALPPKADSPKIAAAAARRLKMSEQEIRGIMARCEAIIAGKHVSDSELLGLVTRIREIEAALKV
ncbi:MAG TPA: DUF4350 domain-containing protein [Blastocatellia bacterium]|nr:DUF4350 domain-containing protein [Blastocatellia bacterium]